MTSAKIDPSKLPYRRCVGAMILNPAKGIWIGRRTGTAGTTEGFGSWQMPQGGIDDGEAPEVAVLREAREETGMTSLEILGEIPGWHNYDLPPELLGKALKGKYRGQTQKWFVLRFTGPTSEVNITPDDHDQEFDAWRWAGPNELLSAIVPFKRGVYQIILAHARQMGLI